MNKVLKDSLQLKNKTKKVKISIGETEKNVDLSNCTAVKGSWFHSN